MPLRRGHCLPFAVALAAALGLARPGLAQTWTGAAGDNNWNNAANWNPATIPNAAAAAVTFPVLGAPTIPTTDLVNVATSVQVGSLTFTDPRVSQPVAVNYDLTSSAGQTLSGLTAITVAGNVNYEGATINLANVATGSLLFTGSGAAALTITTNSSLATLIIGPNTVIGTPFSGGITVTGVGSTTIGGSFAPASSGNNVIGGLTKTGPGTLDLSGNGANLGGGLTLNGGSLVLDYTTNSATKLASTSGLTLSGGSLLLMTNSTVVSQSIRSRG
jgi:fibronectin-binding autotransporter adhesin